MTAVEYLKKRTAFRFSFFITIFAAFAGAALGYVLDPSRPRGQEVAIWIAAGYLIFGLGTALGGYLLDRRFVHLHPEMVHLNEWMQIMGSVEGYPVELHDSLALIPIVVNRLEHSATFANAAFKVRDQIGKIVEQYETGAPEAVLLLKVFEQLVAAAEAQNKQYLREWDLFVGNLRILRGAPYLTPKEYREGLLKKAQAPSLG